MRHRQTLESGTNWQNPYPPGIRVGKVPLVAVSSVPKPFCCFLGHSRAPWAQPQCCNNTQEIKLKPQSIASTLALAVLHKGQVQRGTPGRGYLLLIVADCAIRDCHRHRRTQTGMRCRDNKYSLLGLSHTFNSCT